jgi:transposase-like protein
MDTTLVGLSRFLHDEQAAREFMERLRWPDGPVCPRDGCGSKKVYRLNGKATRPGVLKCGTCRRQFTVTVGSVFEDSHIPLGKWVVAIYRICASKKGVSSHQLMRELGITYRSAWFMTHRIRYAMTQSPLAEKLNGVVEADETFIGPKRERGKPGRSYGKKQPVMTLIQRGGHARSFMIRDATSKTLKGIIRENVDRSAHIMTDDWLSYTGLDREFAGHSVVRHTRGEYVKGLAYTNLAESFFSLVKRGVVGTFHHVSKRHMPRYLAEFDFRWNYRGIADGERTMLAIKGAEGKRLTLRPIATELA